MCVCVYVNLLQQSGLVCGCMSFFLCFIFWCCWVVVSVLKFFGCCLVAVSCCLHFGRCVGAFLCLYFWLCFAFFCVFIFVRCVVPFLHLLLVAVWCLSVPSSLKKTKNAVDTRVLILLNLSLAGIQDNSLALFPCDLSRTVEVTSTSLPFGVDSLPSFCVSKSTDLSPAEPSRQTRKRTPPTEATLHPHNNTHHDTHNSLPKRRNHNTTHPFKKTM